MKTLKDKVAIITGCGQGVGKGIALALSKEGAKIIAAGRTFSKVKQTADEIESKGGNAFAIECDVTSLEDIQNTVSASLTQYNRIDILVNNAQLVPLGNILEVTDSAFESGWNSGPLAVHRFMKLCYPHLKSTQGSIINLGTGAAIRPDPGGYGLYAAVKEAIRALTRAAAVEWGKDGIRVNTIIPIGNSPGMKIWEELVPEEANAFKESIPLGRIGDCENDVGKAIVSLVGPNMKYITGATIPVDGGHSHLR